MLLLFFAIRVIFESRCLRAKKKTLWGFRKTLSTSPPSAEKMNGSLSWTNILISGKSFDDFLHFLEKVCPKKKTLTVTGDKRPGRPKPGIKNGSPLKSPGRKLWKLPYIITVFVL